MTSMNSESIINRAIAHGEGEGLMALAPIEQVVFANAEAEVYCDMEGVDSLLERYGRNHAALFARAFSAIGAGTIAQAFVAIADSSVAVEEERLARLNALITKRHEYTYENIQAFVEQSMHRTDAKPLP